MTTSDIRRLLPVSIPLARLMMASIPGAKGVHCSSTLRNPWEGTAMNTTPAPRSASSREDVAVSPSGRRIPGR